MENHNTDVPMIEVGGSYPQDDCTLRVLSMQNEYALLEQWGSDGKLVQYIVTHWLFFDDGELHWHGSGKYFPCMFPPPICDTPYDALRKAMQCFLEKTQPDTSRECDMDQDYMVKPAATEIVIYVEGGKVQGVCSTNPHTSVQIADRDVIANDPDADEEAAFDEADARAHQDDMIGVY